MFPSFRVTSRNEPEPFLPSIITLNHPGGSNFLFCSGYNM
ncbi:TPA: H-X9-DG-CTERM domain-containing protein [Enterobacter hormaechei]